MNDTDPMPFGKYKGTLMQDVPVEYLHWLYYATGTNGQCVRDYIKDNIDALKMENKDLIWN